jgi:hypothetical protein
MPDAWSDKDERKYQHVKASEKARGKSAAKAKEIAARTVNQQRHSEGRTPNKTSQSTGNPSTPLPERSKQQLYNRAQQLNIAGRSRMNKDELVQAIRKRS